MNSPRTTKFSESLQSWFTGKRFVIGVPFMWLFLLTAAPILIILRISFAEMGDASVSSLFHWAENILSIKINFANYAFIFREPLYVGVYISSLRFGLETTIYCLILGYPFAYFMARAKSHVRPTLVMLVMLPFWTSFLLRIYAWIALLTNNGLVNKVLLWTHMIAEPLHMMNTNFSLMIGMVYAYLPFMILPLYSNLVKMDLRLIEASADLGASPWRTFWLVTVPLSKQGIIAGSMLVFIPAVGEYVIPELLGGPETLKIGRVLWDEFFSNNDWTMASAVAVVMILMILLPIAIFNKYQSESNEGAKV